MEAFGFQLSFCHPNEGSIFNPLLASFRFFIPLPFVQKHITIRYWLTTES